jgi:hypothetical protein
MSGINGTSSDDEAPDAPEVELVEDGIDCDKCKNTRQIVHGGVIPCPYCTKEGIAQYGILTLDPTKLTDEEKAGYLESRRALGI